MTSKRNAGLTRRAFLKGVAVFGTATGLGLPPNRVNAVSKQEFGLRPQPGRVRLVPEPYRDTAVWCFNRKVPGPEIRVRQGDQVKVVVENDLSEETTVHWHGMRVRNAMDGVPHLTQQPISAGSRFVYEFDAVDAGTFWYHPHQRSFEQVGRGLYGPLIVEEREPLPVDRDITWVLDDWRLLRSAEIAGGFGDMHDMSHAGRIGNTVTINGTMPETFEVHQGERIRLRLINAANARIFGLEFDGHTPTVIALDGQPVTPHVPAGNRVVLGPAMRADLILDMTGDPAAQYGVTDTYYRDLEYQLLDIVYSETSLRQQVSDSPIVLPPNPLPEPDLTDAERHDVTFGGGMMGGMSGAMMGGRWRDIRSMMHEGNVWAINGVAATGHVMDPLITIDHGKSCVLALINETAWPHPMHLHGHSFRVLSRNGEPTENKEWQDTVLMGRRERVEIAFVADNPGDWMFHCHILEHQASGMMGVIRVGDEGYSA
jgi:FtsP/CotA-like multicopper oxidase with cupredoxin domain